MINRWSDVYSNDLFIKQRFSKILVCVRHQISLTLKTAAMPLNYFSWTPTLAQPDLEKSNYSVFDSQFASYSDELASGVQTIQFMFSLLVYTLANPNTAERSHFSRVSRTTRSAGVIFPFPSDKKTPYLCSVQFHWIAQMVLNIN